MHPLWKHQQVALERYENSDEIALFFEQGCGKTRTAIEILRCRYGAKLLPTLVLCPLAVVENWRREFLQYSNVADSQIIILQNDKIKALNRRPDNNRIFITNYESLLNVKLLQILTELMPGGVIVADESQKIKNPQSKRTKAILYLGKIAKTKIILSGTPILNSILDVYTQFKFLDEGKTFLDFSGRPMNFWAFRNFYMFDKNAGMPKGRYFPNWQIKPGAIAALNDKIYQKAMRVEKKTCLDLPPLVRQREYVVLEGETKRLYDSMKKDFIAYFGETACVATIAIVKGLRLLQIVNGFVALENGEVETLHSNKLSALKELLETLAPEHRIIVWATFRENYRAISEVCTKLKLKHVFLNGEQDGKQKQAAIDAFQTDPDTRILIGNPNAGGIGVNLTAASYSIYFSRNFSLEADLQSEARNHRGGSEIHEKITRIDLIAQDTIDEDVLKALENKQDMSFAMLRQWARRGENGLE